MITKIKQWEKINEMGKVRTNTEKDDEYREFVKQTRLSRKGDKMNFEIDEPTDDEVMKDDWVAPFKETLNTAWLEMKISAKQPFFVMGHAGWGKTSIIKQVAKAYGLTIITIYLDKALPEDLGGIPIATKSSSGTTYVDNALPKWAQYIYDHPDDDFLVFFDEMNQASPDVQNALMPIILESEIAGIKFHNIWFGAAGNYSEENDSVSQLSAPLRSRFIKENIWNESWEEAFEYIIGKYEGKLPKELLDIILENNISANPRELSAFLDYIIGQLKLRRKHPLQAVLRGVEGFNTLDKPAEVKKIAQEVFNVMNTENSGEKKKEKKAKISRPVLSSGKINKIKSLIKSGGYINDDGDFIDLANDWQKQLKLTPEEAELIKKSMKTNINERRRLNESHGIVNVIARDRDHLKMLVDEKIEHFGPNCNLNYIDTSNVTEMDLMFDGSEFNGDISQWDTSNVTNMNQMFDGSEFNGDISQWNTANVKSMQFMFHVSKFNGDISQWNTANVTDMNNMFAYSKFNRDISQWNTSNVTDMTYMFDDSKFNGDISQWNTSNVTIMNCMFFDSKFNGDISQWDTQNVTNMFAMFDGSEFNGDISQWDTSNVTNMSGMFNESEFNGDISQWNTSNVKSMTDMFTGSPLENNKPSWYK